MEEQEKYHVNAAVGTEAVEEDSWGWLRALLPEQEREVRFAIMYHDNFNHRTEGHNRLVLIAVLARMLANAMLALAWYQRQASGEQASGEQEEEAG